MCLTPFSYDNEDWKEDEILFRIMGSTEDTHHVYDCDNKYKKDNNNKLLSIVTTPTRDFRKIWKCLSYFN